MYTIKSKPEDFVVKEISNVKISDKGSYAIIRVVKKDYTTMKAVELIADRLGVVVKDIGFAGTKDRRAVTTQLMSVKGVSRERIDKIEFENIEVEYLGRATQPISLGDLEGNRFEIILRDVDKVPKSIERFPNLFGEQRFSENNEEIGKAIIKKEFGRAVELIVENGGYYERDAEQFITENPGNFVGALNKLPRKILLLYIHSYQSWIFNRTVDKLIEIGIEVDEIPLIGFGTELENETSEVAEVIGRIMAEETINERDFILKQFPNMSLEGDRRSMFVSVSDLKIEGDKKKLKVSFSLPKGSYATVFIDYLMRS